MGKAPELRICLKQQQLFFEHRHHGIPGRKVLPPLCSTKPIPATQRNWVGFTAAAHIRPAIPLLAQDSPGSCTTNTGKRKRPCKRRSCIQGRWELTPVLCRFTLKHQSCLFPFFKVPCSAGNEQKVHDLYFGELFSFFEIFLWDGVVVFEIKIQPCYNINDFWER